MSRLSLNGGKGGMVGYAPRLLSVLLIRRRFICLARGRLVRRTSWVHLYRSSNSILPLYLSRNYKIALKRKNLCSNPSLRPPLHTYKTFKFKPHNHPEHAPTTITSSHLTSPHISSPLPPSRPLLFTRTNPSSLDTTSLNQNPPCFIYIWI